MVKASNGDEAAACARKMLADVCRHLGIAVPVQAAVEDASPGGGAIDGMQLAGLYEEIKFTCAVRRGMRFWRFSRQCVCRGN